MVSYLKWPPVNDESIESDISITLFDRLCDRNRCHLVDDDNFKLYQSAHSITDISNNFCYIRFEILSKIAQLICVSQLIEWKNEFISIYITKSYAFTP